MNKLAEIAVNILPGQTEEYYCKELSLLMDQFLNSPPATEKQKEFLLLKESILQCYREAANFRSFFQKSFLMSKTVKVGPEGNKKIRTVMNWEKLREPFLKMIDERELAAVEYYTKLIESL